jgi:SdrD B-like domain
MVIQSLNFRSKSREARSRWQTRSPRIEICERRMLLASNGFLQGIVSLSGSSQGLAGASIQLQKLDSPSIPNQTTTTNASGAYLFQNLPSGKYLITETPPSGYVNDASQPNSPLTPIISQTSSSIEVQLSDPSQLQVSYPSNNKEPLTITSNPPLSTPTGLVGQLNITVNEPDISYTTPLFPSFCVDLYRDIFTGDTNLPYSMEPLSTALANDSQVKNPQNAGEIAYLYNHFGSTWSTDPNNYVPVAEAAGFQLAIWELEYETSGTYNVLNGSFYAQSAQGLTASSPEVQYAQNFLTQAQGQNELAVYLSGLPTSTGSQGLIAPESLNFANVPGGQPSLPTGIGGFVYVDANNNGIKDSGEPPIPGTTVTLTGTNDLGATITPIVTTTNSAGAYSFNNLLPGTYTVTETQPAGYLQGTNAVGTVNGTVVGQLGPGVDVISNIVLLTAGNDGVNYNFGDLLPADIGGFVYVDVNHNGVKNIGEPPIPGTTITLTGTNDLGAITPIVTTTDSTGAYSFDNLRPGTYIVTETQPAGYLQGTNAVGTINGTVVGQLGPGVDVISHVVLAQGNAGVNYNFGEILNPSLVAIGGTVFCDCNNDGIQQPSETGIPGVTLTLTGVDTTGTHVQLVTTTNGQGTYDFGPLNPGTYTITESAPSGYFEGKNTAGTAGGTVSGDVISGITLIAGVDASGYNFADLTPSTLSGVVYYDLNHNDVMGSHNDVMDSVDFGIAHVTVTLNGTNDLGQSIHMTTVTNNNGVYSFGDLRPGTYDIIRTQPAIFRGYKNAAGSLGGTVNKDSITDISVPGCANGVDYLFGELQKPTCSLHGLAISVGNLFYHFERTYHSDPVAFAKQYPNLTPSIAAGQVPWGKAPFPSAPVASYWVPTLGTKPIKIYPVKGVKYNPLVASTSGKSAVVKVAHAHTSSLKPVSVHASPSKPALLRRLVRK